MADSPSLGITAVKPPLRLSCCRVRLIFYC